jgi:hypothetical protein
MDIENEVERQRGQGRHAGTVKLVDTWSRWVGSDKDGQPKWTYDLVQEVREGDKIFHYKGSAIVGVSRAVGRSWFDDVIWVARGAASRTARIEPHRNAN